jgi:hypothetical protein
MLRRVDPEEPAEPIASASPPASVSSAPPALASVPPPSWQVRRARRKRWGRAQVAIGIVVLLFFVIVGATITRERLAGSPNASVFRGAYLGMTAPELRHRFAPGTDGHWAASTSSVGEEALVWTADAPGAQIAHAAFEFHDRILVAVRADLAAGAPEATEPPRTVTPVTVRARGMDAGQPSLTILARDCPTHAPEVARLLASEN